jgi:hypothetical protein
MKQTDKQPYDTVGIITRMIPGQGYAFVRGQDGLTSFAHADEFKNKEYTFEHAREGHTVKYRVTYDGDRGNGQRARNLELLGER